MNNPAMIEPRKICETCCQPFGRRYKEAFARWDARRFCGHSCKGKWISTSRTRPIKDRLLEKVCIDLNTGCWLWAGRCNEGGYGTIKAQKKTKLAHRVSYEIFVEHIPNGLFVLHQCDVRCCINPLHLFIGTQTDNMRDMVAKKRNRDVAGENNPRAILTVSKVREIRASGLSRSELSKAYGVTYQTIRDVQEQKTWAQV